MEEILEKVGMVVHGEIHEVLPTGTPVGESKTIQLEVRSFLSLVLYQGKWEDDRQKSNCRFCSARIPLPEGVAGKVDMLFTYNSNCLIDIQVVLNGEVKTHVRVRDKWYNDQSEDPLCIEGESENLRIGRRRKELIMRCKDLLEKLRNNISKDTETVGSLLNKIKSSNEIGELNIYGSRLAEIEKKLWVVCFQYR